MAKKVFRPYDIQRTSANAGWFDSQAYGPQAIAEIKDPDGGSPTKDITSIPSPFARIDLVMTAFHEVNNLMSANPSAEELKIKLEIPTMYHRLVSEAFDVAEIFFNIEHLRDRFEVIVWDKNTDIDANNPFGKTVRMYLDADAQAYNFNQMNRLYLLNYIGPGHRQMHIVGATSPVTMFFPTADDEQVVSENVIFGNDRPFDNLYAPLYRRDFDFVKYLYAFRAAHKDTFARLFGELNRYLDHTYNVLKDGQKNEIDAIDATSIAMYNPMSVDGSQANVVDVLGMPLHIKTADPTKWQSDFYIKSDVYKDDPVPMVLPVEKGNMYANWKYTTDNWGTMRAAPYKCDTPWMDRSLPEANSNYPYLTISDFLEDTIIKIPYELNNESFYNGGYVCNPNSGDDEKASYLLPLTDTFFTFFTTEDLKNGGMITIKEIVSGVKVRLKVKVVNGKEIEYSRVYFEGQPSNAYENQGTLIETKLGLGIMPLVKFAQDIHPHYRIAFFDKGDKDASLSFYEGVSCMELDRTSTVRTAKDLNGKGCSHEAFALEHNFDRIKVRIGDSYNFIVPKFVTKAQKEVYTFAVDFGTTNTHIEYCTGYDHEPTPFKIGSDEVQLHQLHTKYVDSDIRVAFEQDFIPKTIGADDDKYGFPMRTAFAERSGINYAQNPVPLCDGNIPFQYEHESIPSWNKVKTELKWSSDSEEDNSRLALNIETLFILLRNKVILGEGNLAATKIIWFYPASMTVGKVKRFRRIWADAYTKYFGNPQTKYFGNPQKNLISISESIAPVLNFQDAPNDMVTIDVGGGTTDVFVREGGEDRMLMSFRFASNAIFGDAWRSIPARNGFVNRYLNKYKKILGDNEELELQLALQQIESQGKSADIVAFLFSLAKNNGNRALDFLNSLVDDSKMRYVFILFYGSIFYFIARVMKARGLRKPQGICFSGNGSKTVDVLSTDLEIVANFAKMIFDKVYGSIDGFLSVDREESPKTATCKGGIKAVSGGVPYEYNPEIETVVAGNNLDENTLCTMTYEDINDEVMSSVVNSVVEFLKMLFELNNDNFWEEYLDADPSAIGLVKSYCLGEEGKQTLAASISRGVRDKQDRDGVNNDTRLEETLFFYPLVGLLHDLAFKLSQK